ncbi:hypothetical protein ACH5RR_001505 [Cinchona calisaya]|uniref:Uncharacterized protein n=1 Tax=Cinchona calisaya TaxID=153742 RepID=A0ABD3B3P2_9GENT
MGQIENEEVKSSSGRSDRGGVGSYLGNRGSDLWWGYRSSLLSHVNRSKGNEYAGCMNGTSYSVELGQKLGSKCGTSFLKW